MCVCWKVQTWRRNKILMPYFERNKDKVSCSIFAFMSMKCVSGHLTWSLLHFFKITSLLQTWPLLVAYFKHKYIGLNNISIHEATLLEWRIKPHQDLRLQRKHRLTLMDMHAISRIWIHDLKIQTADGHK